MPRVSLDAMHQRVDRVARAFQVLAEALPSKTSSP
jgi:hypothetical protein